VELCARDQRDSNRIDVLIRSERRLSVAVVARDNPSYSHVDPSEVVDPRSG
jgi:hypothetical protein